MSTQPTINALFLGGCASLMASGIAAKTGFITKDLSATPDGLAHEISSWVTDNKGQAPDVFICNMSPRPQISVHKVSEVCKKADIPLILMASKNDYEKGRALASELSVGFVPRACLKLQAKDLVLGTFREQILLAKKDEFAVTSIAA